MATSASCRPAVAVKLADHKELEPAGSIHQLPVPGPREQKIKHDVVGEQDVGWRGDDLVPLLGAPWPA
jgi:hypothetical protein